VRRLGFHLSIAGGLTNLIPRALRRHCNTVQLFTSAPAQWKRRNLGAEEAAAFRQALAAADIQPYFVHAIYLLNLASPDRTLWCKSLRHLTEELQRAARLRAAGVVLHLGSVGEGGRAKAGVRRLARALVEARERSETQVPLILENSAGAGNTLGSTPEQLGEIIARAAPAAPLEVCLDTCHAFAAGLPVHTDEGLEEVLARLDTNCGPDRLRLIHLNDSLGEFASHRDRHWHLGKGHLGRRALEHLVNHPRLRALPFIIETPGTEEDDRRNMRAVRRLLPKQDRPPLRRT